MHEGISDIGFVAAFHHLPEQVFEIVEEFNVERNIRLNGLEIGPHSMNVGAVQGKALATQPARSAVVLLFKCRFCLLRHFEKFVIKLFELRRHPFGGYANPLRPLRGTDHAKGEALLIIADCQCHIGGIGCWSRQESRRMN